MDSINQQQPEGNREDLNGEAALDRIRQVLEKTQSCFFCTAVNAGGSSGSTRPMSVLELGDDGTLWFLSASDSNKNRELARDPTVRLFFQGTEHDGFLTLTGTAQMTTDPARIDALWKPVMTTWFPAGRDDPRITAVGVKPQSGYYWDTKHGRAMAGIKMLVGAAIGKTLDDSVEGQLQP